MTLIAQFDLQQDPPVVVTLYDYGDDNVPKHYQPPEYVDVTDEDPRPQPGSTYDGEEWVHPPPPVDTQAWAAATVDRNQAFLTDPDTDDVAYRDQVQALTVQVNAILRQQYPAVPPPLDLPGTPGYEPDEPVEEPPVEEPPPVPDEEPVEPPEEEEPEEPKTGRYIDSADPNTGPKGGGVPITLHGGGFSGTGEVRFEQEGSSTQWAWGFQVIDDNTMTVTVPPGNGTVDIVLIANQDTARLDGGFTYV